MSTPGEAMASRGLRDAARVMYEETRTGILEVQSPQGTVLIHVKEGKVVHAVPPPGSDWLLGHVLVESGSVPEKKLYRILGKQRKTGRPLENLLIEGGTLTQDVLSKFLDLQLRETILPLFLQTDVRCEFRDEPPHVSDFVRPVPIPFLLKEADRRAKEWPILLRLGIARDAVFDKTDESISQFLGSTEGGGEEAAAPGVGQMGAGERLVYYYVNGKKTVQQVSYASCLGEFETVRAIALLKRRGFIFLTERKGAGEEHEDPTILPKLVGFTFYLVLGVLVAVLVLVQPKQLVDLAGVVTGQQDMRSALVLGASEARLRAGVEMFYAEHGRYPHALGELAPEFLPEGEVAYQSGHLEYKPLSEGFVLRGKR